VPFEKYASDPEMPLGTFLLTPVDTVVAAMGSVSAYCA
jgi:hypothetical protein